MRFPYDRQLHFFPPAAPPSGAAQASNMQTSNDEFVPGAGQTMAVLAAFSPVFSELGIAEIAQRAALPVATARGIAATLSSLGYLQAQPDSGRYRLGAKLVDIARSFLGARGLRAAANGHMEALAARLRAPLAMSERDGLEMVYLHYIRGDAPVVVQHRIGTRLPLATSASGRAWLGSAPTAEVEAVVRQLDARSVQGATGLQEHLAMAKRDLAELGFTRSYGDMHPEVNAVAVPLRSPIDGSQLVVSLAAPSMLVPSRRCDSEFGPALVAMAAEVVRDLEASR